MGALIKHAGWKVEVFIVRDTGSYVAHITNETGDRWIGVARNTPLDAIEAAFDEVGK